MLQPSRRRTWALRGQTPVQYTWDRHDRFSVITAITLAPRRKRFGLYFHMQRRNIRFDSVLEFVSVLLRRLQRGFILVLDRYNVHRKAARLLLDKTGRVGVEWLPAYAPEINPVEQVWNRSKNVELGNFIPEDADHLGREIKKALRRQRGRSDLFLSYFKHAGLVL